MKSQPISNDDFLNSTDNRSGDKNSDVGSFQDEKIWSKFKSGDEEAFIYIYNEYANTLFKYGSQFTSDTDLLKDCLQDFFIYLREKRTKLGDTESIKFYLLKSFRRRVIDYIKQNKKYQNQLNDSFTNSFPIELSHEIKYINQQTQEKQLKLLEKGLAKLNEREREAIYIYYFQDLTYDQIADFFNFSHVSSARRLVYKALSKLKTGFGFSLLIAVALLG